MPAKNYKLAPSSATDLSETIATLAINELSVIDKPSSVPNASNGTNGTAMSSNDHTAQTDESKVPTTNGVHTESPANGEAPQSGNVDILEDPLCCEKTAHKITFQDVTTASFLIKGGVEYTPCSRSQLSRELGMDIYLKKEFQQYTGSFKERGARYALLMLTDEQRKRGVISASLGNHAQGLAYHAQLLEIACTVVMPTAAPLMKVQNCRKYGANVIIFGHDMAAAKSHALAISKRDSVAYINGYDHPHIIAGQGTIGLEICEQVRDADAVVVPVGGGGLIAGVAAAVRALQPRTKIIGVESAKCQGFTNALAAGRPIYTPNEPTLADGLAVPTVGYNAFVTVQPLLDKMVVVQEEWIALAILRLVELEKCVVEGAGAICLAAILGGHLDEFRNKKVVLVLGGGNIDTTMLGRCLERGLAAEGRLLQFTVTVSDRPGGIAELCKMLASVGVSIKDIMHERAWIRDIYSVEVKVVCETRDWEHAEELRTLLRRSYPNVVFKNARLAISSSVSE